MMLIFGNVGPFVLNLLPFRNEAKVTKNDSWLVAVVTIFSVWNGYRSQHAWPILLRVGHSCINVTGTGYVSGMDEAYVHL